MKKIAMGFLLVGWWVCLSVGVGYYIGSNGGYKRGVKDALAAMLVLRDAHEPPEAWSRGEI